MKYTGFGSVGVDPFRSTSGHLDPALNYQGGTRVVVSMSRTTVFWIFCFCFVLFM